jgi:hypothetical protein
MTRATLLRTSASCVAGVAAAAMFSTAVQTSPAQAGAPAVVAQQAPAATASKLAPLFSPAARPAPERPSDLARYAVRRTFLTISEKALAEGAILNAEAHLLNLFPDVQIVAIRRGVDSHSSRDYSWSGYIPGDEFGEVIIAVLDGHLGATILYRNRRYVVLPTATGRHEVLEIDEARVPEGEVRDERPAIPVGGRGSGRTAPSSMAGLAVDVDGLVRAVDWELVNRNPDLGYFPLEFRDDGSVVDLLVLYTPDAARVTDPNAQSEPWNLFLRIVLSTIEANKSFEKSGIPTRLKMVPSMPIAFDDFVESGDLLTDLYAAKDSRQIAAWQDLYAADVVVLVTAGQDPSRDKKNPNADQWCSGKAAYSSPEETPTGVSVVHVSCMLSQYTLAHEVGHHFGAEHDWYATLADGGLVPEHWDTSPKDNHGYVQIASWETAVRTIMAYGTYCAHLGITCKRIGRWSNPNDITQNGLPLGIPYPFPYQANDARVLTQNREKLANRRHSICRMLSSC